MKLEYPASIKIVRLPCSGKVDVLYLLKAFENGASGVFVAGCEEGNCHFLQGNFRAKKRVGYAKRLLEEIGIEKERLEMFNISASQGKRFAQVCQEMAERVERLDKNDCS